MLGRGLLEQVEEGHEVAPVVAGRMGELEHLVGARRGPELAFAEGLVLAERSGIDRKLAVGVMTGSPIGSPMLKARADLVLDLPDEAWFDVGLLQKDVVLALDTARQLGVLLLSAAAADEVLTLARAAGYEHRDMAALFEVLAQLTGDTPRPTA